MTQRGEPLSTRTPSPGPSTALVQRVDLIDLLEAGADRPITLVAAPAGSGKTVLVRSWLEARGPEQPSAWVAVERRERDAQRFWASVVAALAAAAPAGSMAQAPPTPEFRAEVLIRNLVSELAALTRRIVLVIDDAHEIVDSEILDGLKYLFEHVPPTLHVVLITRHDLQVGLQRHQLATGMTEIRSAQLRFSLSETQRMFEGSGVELSPHALAQLHERTEGWVAGLRLAAISLATHPDPEQFVAAFSGSDRAVADYLLEEVLDRQPPDVRRLLVRSSLLTRVNGELGDLMTGASGSERSLRALAGPGGLVVALDPEQTWFRFHRLFGDLLALELRQTAPDEIAELHLRAAAWYAEHDEIPEAIAHARAGGDHPAAAELLIANYFSLTLDGRQAMAHALLEDFGSAAQDGPIPELAVVQAQEQLADGSLDEASAYVALAERNAHAVRSDPRRFTMALLMTKLSLTRRRGDFDSVRHLIEQAGTLLEPRDTRDIAINNDVRALTLLNLGIVEVWSGRVSDGAAHLGQARELAQRIGRPYLEVSSLAHESYAASWDSFSRGRDAARESISLAAAHGWAADPVVAPALVTLGVTLIQAGRLGEAERRLAEAEAALREALEPAVGYMLRTGQGTLALLRGHHEAGIAAYRAAERLDLALVKGSPLANELRWGIAHAQLALGRAELVREQLAELDASERETGEAREVRSALALADGDPQTALEVLAPTIAGQAEAHHPLVLVRSLLRQALAYRALGEITAAEAAVERALDLAEPDALILPFIYVDSRDLLERHPRFRTAHGAFIAEILDALSDRPGRPDPGDVAALSEPLSDAELRVLRFLPTNLSAEAIASELFVSVNTVKTHMRHIYAKLDVHSRIEAVERARRLGLVGGSARHG
jgi:LuxR family maltose regulon positive regulatory protein